MIARYTRPEMGALWTDEHRIQTWLRVELAALRGLRVDAARMRANLDLTHGLIHSQPVLLRLVEKGAPREDAYRWVQRNAMKSWKSGTPLLDLVAADPDIAQIAPRRELAACFDLKRHFRAVGLPPA